MQVKVLVILLKYMCTFVNVGYIVPTCVELYRDIVWEIFLDILILQESFLHSAGKFLQIQKIIKNATTHFNFCKKISCTCRKNSYKFRNHLKMQQHILIL